MDMWEICINNKNMIFYGKIRSCIQEHAMSNSFEIVDYCDKFVDECTFSYGEDEFGEVRTAYQLENIKTK